MGRAWAKRSSKNKKIRLAAIAAALSTGGIVIALLPSANADQKALKCRRKPLTPLRPGFSIMSWLKCPLNLPVWNRRRFGLPRQDRRVAS